MLQLICTTCLREFSRKKNQIKSDNHFCSRSCASIWKNRSKKKVVLCKICQIDIPHGHTYCPPCKQQKTEQNILKKKLNCPTRIKDYRHRRKQKALDYKGNCCQNCGYDKCARALHFHHQDPSIKDGNISQMITSQKVKWELIQAELDKCILLCANCHAEEHDRLDKA